MYYSGLLVSSTSEETKLSFVRNEGQFPYRGSIWFLEFLRSLRNLFPSFGNWIHGKEEAVEKRYRSEATEMI